MENITMVFTMGNKLYLKAEMYDVILDHCKNWWGKEKLTDLYHKKFYKNRKNAEKEARKVSDLISKKYDTDVKLCWNILQDKDTNKYFLVFEWSTFQRHYGNGTYLFELSDYGHFQV